MDVWGLLENADFLPTYSHSWGYTYLIQGVCKLKTNKKSSASEAAVQGHGKKVQWMMSNRRRMGRRGKQARHGNQKRRKTFTDPRTGPQAGKGKDYNHVHRGGNSSSLTAVAGWYVKTWSGWREKYVCFRRQRVVWAEGEMNESQDVSSTPLSQLSYNIVNISFACHI